MHPSSLRPQVEATILESDGIDTPTADRKLSVRGQRRGLFRTPSFILGSAITLFWLACAVAPGLFTNREANEVVLNSEGASIPRSGPQADAWFGTDTIGEDVFSRVMHGAENTVVPALLATVVAVLVGAAAGLMMGPSRGWVDKVLSRTLEVVVSLPVVLLVIMVFVIYGNSRFVLVVTIASLSAPFVTKTVRSAVLAQARLGGAASARQRSETAAPDLWRETLPNLPPFLLIEFTERFRYAIFTVATVSFLGFGVFDPLGADWGRDFANAYPLIQAGLWWPAFFPALAISSTALATNLIGHSIDKVDRTQAAAMLPQVIE